MQQETDTLGGILDIVLPLAPADAGWDSATIVAITVLLTGMLIGAGYGWWKTPRQHSRRKLGQLLHQYRDGHIDSHEAVYRLAEILRERMRCHQLSSKTDLPLHLQRYQSRWCMFINELDTSRYSGADIEETVLGRLVDEARFWLGRW